MVEKVTNEDEQTHFPAVDRSVVKVGSIFDKSDEKAYWLNRTPLERLEALQLMREIAFGHDAATARLQRVVEVAELPRR
jgi:hypothetical protein